MPEKPKPVKLLASFTGTLRGIYNGEVTDQDLRTGWFMFGCTREHAVDPWRDSCNEVNWFWKNNEDGRKAHKRLVVALMHAENEGRVLWREECTPSVRVWFMRMVAAAGTEVVR
jgi:hypothetical protein